MLHGTPDVTLWAQQFNSAYFRYPDLAEHDPPFSTTTEFYNLYQADPAGLDRITELLSYKQQMDPATIVIAVQGVAAHFLANHGDEIYPGAQKIYVLPGQDLLEQIESQPRTRIIPTAMRDAIGDTALMVRQLLPDVKKLLVISGANELDRIYLDYARDALSERAGQLPPIEYLVAQPLDDLERRLANETSTTAALMLTFEGDPAGKVYRNSVDVMPRIARTSAIPIFSAYDTLLGTGTVGGVMSSTSRYGEVAAAMTVALVDNEVIEREQVVTATRTVFDGEVLRRHGIPVERVPEGAEVVNYAEPVYVTYAAEIVTAIAVMLLQLMFIISLLRLSRQKSRAASELDAKARDLSRRTLEFESVVHSVPDALVIVAVDGTISHTNREGFESTFGYSPASVVGSKVDMLMADGATLMVNDREKGENIAKFVDANRRTFPGEWIATQIRTDSQENLGHVILIRDVSERIAIEEERRHAHSMEALGNLAGGIAHDFNNILSVMIGNAELIEYGSNDPKEAADQIVRAGTRGRDLIRQILAFSRKDANRNQMKVVSIRHVLQESLGFLRASMPSTIKVTLEMPESFNAAVIGDEVQLEQMLINLATNARDAMQSRGEIRIEVTIQNIARALVVSHGVTPEGETVRITVTDSGSGMDTEASHRAFEPFYTTKRAGEGTGMGLALVYGIVMSHKGAIDLKSRLDEGTTFNIYIPASAPLPAGEEELGSAVPACGDGRALLVEDDLAVLTIAESMLQRLGFNIDAYNDPEAALEAFKNGPEYDVIITDRTMPRLDGLRLIKAIRDLGSTVPIVICSGFTESIEQADFDAAAPIEILSKPYRLADLAEAIGKARLV